MTANNDYDVWQIEHNVCMSLQNLIQMILKGLPLCQVIGSRLIKANFLKRMYVFKYKISSDALDTFCNVSTYLKLYMIYLQRFT